MSAKKSWDVQPRRAARPAPAPSRRGVSVDAVRTTRNMNVSRTSDGRLRERRKKARKTGLIISLITLLLFFVLLLYLLWLPAVRIQTVEASGPNAEEAAQTARESISGTYLYVLPRNSIFFFPKERVRKTVLAAHPQISALSVSRKSFTSIQLSGTSRASSFVWCGVHIDAAFPGGQCFEADAEGLVFKEAGISTTTSVLSTGSDTPATSGDLRIYSPLDREIGEGQSPIGARVTRAESIPNALRFVKAIRGFGIPVSSLSLRVDEADLWLSSPTRITYVLGREEEAAQLAASVIPTLTLTDGSIEYLDLRFKGKAYVKRYGE